MPRIFHFELFADDCDRARAFYSNVFGWRFTRREGSDGWHIATELPPDPGIDGELVPRLVPGGTMVPMMQVPSVNDYVGRITARGGEILRQTTIPGAGYVAHCRDTEGNVFAILQYDDSAQ